MSDAIFALSCVVEGQIGQDGCY